MRCPDCGLPTKKHGVSRYWCQKCYQWWLIQKLSTYPPPVAVPPNVKQSDEK